MNGLYLCTICSSGVSAFGALYQLFIYQVCDRLSVRNRFGIFLERSGPFAFLTTLLSLAVFLGCVLNAGLIALFQRG